jgi:hypothetical protein
MSQPLYTKSDVMHEFCEISGEVGNHFSSEHSYDCFCRNSRRKYNRSYSNFNNFSFSSTIADFIRDAVREKIARDGKPKSRYPDRSENE